MARFGAHDNATEAKFERRRAASEGVNGTVNLQMELRTAAERQVWRQGAAERRGAAEGQIDKAIAQSQATRETRHQQVEKQSQIVSEQEREQANAQLEVQQREREQRLRMIAQDRQDRQERQQRQRQLGPLSQGYNFLRPSSPELGRGARENKRKPLTTEQTLTRMFPPEVLQLQAETSEKKPAEAEQNPLDFALSPPPQARSVRPTDHVPKSQVQTGEARTQVGQAEDESETENDWVLVEH